MSDLGKRVRANSASEAPETFKHKGELFVRGNLAQIDDSKHNSKWWSYGTKYARPGIIGVVAAFRCGMDHCDNRFFIIPRGSVAHVQRHMETAHQMKRAKTDTSSLPASSQFSGTGSTEPTLGSIKSLFHVVSKDKFQAQLLRLFIIEHLPFNIVNSPEWKDLMKICNPQLATVLMSNDSLYRWARESFDKEKARIKNLLHQSVSKIHISFDMWTSPNRYTIFGVVAHFVRPIEVEGKVLYKNQAVLLAMKRIMDRYTAEELSEEVINICR